MAQITTAPMLTFEQAMALLAEQKSETLAKIEADKKIHEEQMQKRDEELQKQMQKRDEELQ